VKVKALGVWEGEEKRKGYEGERGLKYATHTHTHTHTHLKTHNKTHQTLKKGGRRRKWKYNRGGKNV
jgi:hypothetical protein